MNNSKSSQNKLTLSDFERRKIYESWPFYSSALPSGQYNFSGIKVSILEFFNIQEISRSTPPQSLPHLLDQLRDEYGVIDITLDQLSVQSLKGDSGLMLYVQPDSIDIVKPDDWFRRPLPAQSDGTIILLFRSLPREPVSIPLLLQRVLGGRITQFLIIISIVFISSLIALIPTWFQSYIFDSLVPQGSRFLLLQLAVFLFMIRVTIYGLDLFNEFISLRLELILGFNVTRLLVYRLTQVPLKFFDKYNVGDLQQRIASAHAVRRALQGSIVAVITSVFTIILNLFLIYFKSKSFLICFYLLGLTLIGPLIDVVSACVESYFRLKRLKISGQLQDVILFPLQSMSTIRSLGIESDMFNRYARMRYRLARIDVTLLLIKDILGVFSLLLSALIISYLFYILSVGSSAGGASSLPGQEFLKSQGMIVLLLTAFSTINAAVRSFSASLLRIVKVVPDALRIRPILNQACDGAFQSSSDRMHIHHIYISFRIKQGIYRSDLMQFSLTSDHSIALLNKRSGEFNDLLYCLSCFSVAPYSGSNVLVDSFYINDDFEVSLQDSGCFSGNLMFVSGEFIGLPGSLIDNLTDGSFQADRDLLFQCLNLFNLPHAEDWLQQGAQSLAQSLKRKDPDHVGFKLMLVCALYRSCDVLIVGNEIDDLKLDMIESLISYCKERSVLLLISTSRFEVSEKLDETLEGPQISKKL